MEELIKTNRQELTNKDLRNFTTKLRKCGDNIRKNYIKISHILVEVEKTGCYEDDGFEDVQDYASKVLNIQKTTCYNLLKIGRDYITEDGDKTVLATEDGDYGVSQLQALLPVGIEKATEWNEDGTINPTMSVRQIKNIVASETAEPEDEDDVVDGEATETHEEDLEEYATITLFKSGDVYIKGELPEDVTEEIEAILKKYAESAQA